MQHERSGRRHPPDQLAQTLACVDSGLVNDVEGHLVDPCGFLDKVGRVKAPNGFRVAVVGFGIGLAVEHGDGGARGVDESFNPRDDPIHDDELQPGMVDGPSNPLLEASLDPRLYRQGLRHRVQVRSPRASLSRNHTWISTSLISGT